uniref:MgtE domain-containing protein n=1 Tax=Angiostrongylus cantonensis TaxID=6313 RepID=A0A0K0DQB6_ANGCA
SRPGQSYRSCSPETNGSQESSSHAPNPNPESSYLLFCQVILPFSIGGIGMVFAGVVLDLVQNWRLFKEVPETFILVPALLGLKGNLEMTLASRLSTLANLGYLDSSSERRKVIIANLALIQVQATVIAFLASSFALALAWIPKGQLDLAHATLLCASSLATACFASFILSILMVLVVIFSRKYNINPDNVATPIAASLGRYLIVFLSWGLELGSASDAFHCAQATDLITQGQPTSPSLQGPVQTSLCSTYSLQSTKACNCP